MKICLECKIEKNLEEFHPKRKDGSGRQSRCKTCNANYVKRYYHSNSEYRKATQIRNKKAWHKNRLLLDEYLNNHSCYDCKESDIRVLDFHHKDPSKKTVNISTLVRRAVRWTTILKEIEKCEILCANCHRRRHYRREYIQTKRT